MPTLNGLVYRLRAAATLASKGIFSSSSRFEGRSPLFHFRGQVHIGQHFSTRSLTFRSSIVVEPQASLTIKDRVFINQGVSIWAERDIEIGNRVLIGDLVCIYDSNAHEVVPGEAVRRSPVKIDDDVWIGRNALILPGVTIGRGSVVAAHSVVTKPVPSGVVVAGSPAKIIREFVVDDDFRRR